MKTRIALQDLSSKKSKSTQKEVDLQVNLQIGGNSGAGKTSLLMRFADDTYTDTYTSAIGPDFKIRTIDIDGINVKIKAWDTCAQEKFRDNQSKWQRSLHAVIVVYDVSSETSFNYAKKLIKDLRVVPSDLSIILVGTQSDCGVKRVVAFDAAKAYSDDSKNGIDAFTEVSSKYGDNVQEAFRLAAKAVVKRQLPEKAAQMSEQVDNREGLRRMLKEYIRRIKANEDPNQAGKPNFSFGFWLFASSRAINREANYYLAKELRKQLQDPNKSIAEIFNNYNIIGTRNLIIAHLKLDEKPGFSDRGVNSAELNSVITAARKLMSNDPDERTPLNPSLKRGGN